MDISIGGNEIGRITILLFADRAPKTSENFKKMCEVDSGFCSTGHPLYYKGCPFHKIVPGSYVAGGDVQNGDGTGGESIYYGFPFADENWRAKHVEAGLLSAPHTGPGSHGSQFYITLGAAPELDRTNAVFGQVIDGMTVVQEIGAVSVGSDGRPLVDCIVTRCGRIKEKKNIS